MIKGLSVETTRPLPAAKPQQKTEKQESSFADQLLGAKSERPENLNRNDRNNSGRDSNREEARSIEREKDSKSPTDLRESRDVVRRKPVSTEIKPVRDERDERPDDDERDPQDRVSMTSASGLPPVSHPIPAPRAPASIPSSDDDAPIVIENPKGSDSDELKLPDFFSKTAPKQDGKKAALKDVVEPDEAALATTKAEEAANRHVAMEQFVAKMQNELGIPPEKILEAFSKLDDKALKASPEKSMNQFIKALDLTPKQEARASALYADLLLEMKQGVNFDVMSPHDASLRKLNASLDDMNDSFFRKEVSPGTKKAHEAIDSMNNEIAKLVREKNEAREARSEQNGIAAQAAMMSDNVKDAIQDSKVVDTSASSAADSNSLLSGLMAAQTNPMGSNASMAGGSGGQSEADLSSLMKGEALAKSASGKTALDATFAKEMSKELKDEESDLGKVDAAANAKADAVKSIDAKIDPGATVDTSTPVAGAASKAVMGPGEMLMNRQPTQQDEQDNVRELIKQAQVMIKRGGGEMKMEMKPEGMGSIQLRVNVENGKVNVQMLTESEAAKHLLERGLSELKTNLAAHELKVQSMSVDVGNDVKNRMDQQATHDHARQRAQQFAQEYMSQMRDDNQGFRQSMLGNTGWRQYARPKGPGADLAPESVAGLSSQSRADGSKRLDLVA